MFGERELAQVNPAYFNIIVVTDMDVTVQSKNSGDTTVGSWQEDRSEL